MALHDLRKHYTYGQLDLPHLAADPIKQFQQWFAEFERTEVPEWFETNAMVLSTSAGDRVSSRVVLLKAVSSDGFTFFSNYRSSKAQQLDRNPRAALNFYWPMFERQVRVEGQVSRVSEEVSDAYFEARPFLSRLGAIASPQSQPIDDDQSLADSVEHLRQQYQDGHVPRPSHWGGYLLFPDAIEFWQGKPSRLHDRFLYRRNESVWSIQRLAP